MCIMIDNIVPILPNIIAKGIVGISNKLINKYLISFVFKVYQFMLLQSSGTIHIVLW